jgi:hypothetical protein
MLLAGEVKDSLIHGDENQVLSDREAEQVGAGDLVGALKALEKWRAQCLPVGGDGR